MSDTTTTAFAAARDWRPEPTPEAEADALPSAAAVAIGILRRLAEDPLITASKRVEARRYLRRLEGC